LTIVKKNGHKNMTQCVCVWAHACPHTYTHKFPVWDGWLHELGCSCCYTALLECAHPKI